MSAYLISSTELNQLVKFPLFIKHYIQHKNKDTRLTLWSFIEMHYAHGDVKDADYEEDMKLPFKTHNTCLGNTVTTFIPNHLDGLAIKPVGAQPLLYSSFQENFLTSSYLSSIWQPPKSC